MTITTTRTLTEASRTTVSVHRDGDRVRLRAGVDAGPGRPALRPVLLASDEASARVSLVPDGALLLAGDHVVLEVEVGPGATLELVEPGGTVAYDMRGGSARWDVSVTVADEGRLVWHGEPFVVSAGADVERSTHLLVGHGARVALRETLVLGRHGEAPGKIRQRCSVRTSAGSPVLEEDLLLDASLVGPLLGGSRMVGSAMLLGIDPAPGPDVLVLEAGGALLRRLGDQAHEVQAEERWRSAVHAVRG